MEDTPPSDPLLLGDYPSGTVFRLVRGIRGSVYSIGDRFMLIGEEDCHSPNILKLGGMGQLFFIDPNGKPLKIEADGNQFSAIFEAVVEESTPDLVLTEGEEELPPPRVVSESEFKQFRSGLADLLTEIARRAGERGERGPRGFQGIQGDKGDRGDRGEAGPQGEPGPEGPQGVQGERGETGERGERGETGERGQRGEKGDRGEQGNTGAAGPVGPRGEAGSQGKTGVAGPVGPRGEKGDKGDPGRDGSNGKDGKDGKDGASGKAGPRGPKGDRGPSGERGAAGPQGNTGPSGTSGVVTAKFPLVYDAEEKSIGIDEARLDKILKRIMGGGKVSAQDMGWLASTGGGGKVAVYHNGTKITPDVRGIDFTGSGVASVTKVGGKITVNISGGGGVGATGATGPTGPAGAGVAGNNDVGVMYLKNNTTPTDIPAINDRAVVAGGMTTGKLFNFEKDSGTNSLKYLGAGGRFHVVASFNFSTEVSNNTCGFYVGHNKNIATGLSADGDRVSESEVYIDCPSSSKPVAGTIQTVLDLNTDDRLFFIVQNKDAAKDITVEFLKFVAVTLTSERGATGATGAIPTDYVYSFNGVTGAVQGVSSVSGLTGAVGITGGPDILVTVSGQTLSINYIGSVINGGTFA